MFMITTCAGAAAVVLAGTGCEITGGGDVTAGLLAEGWAGDGCGVIVEGGVGAASPPLDDLAQPATNTVVKKIMMGLVCFIMDYFTSIVGISQ